MEYIDLRLSKALNAISKQEKRLVQNKKFTRKELQVFKQQQIAWVLANLMPPMVGCKAYNGIQQTLTTACFRVEDEFSSADMDAFLEYTDKHIYAVFTNPESTDLERNRAFTRITGLAYILETLIEILVERDLLEMTDSFVSAMKSHHAAVENFIDDVSSRKERTGKWALSGSNYREIDEFRNMGIGMLKGVYVAEWYTAFSIVMYRFLANRLGCDLKDYIYEA